MKYQNNILFFAIIVALVVTACKPDGNDPGYVCMPDMDYSAAYETFSSVKNDKTDFTDSISAREIIPPDDTSWKS